TLKKSDLLLCDSQNTMQESQPRIKHTALQLRQDKFDWHYQERVAVDITRVLQSFSINPAIVDHPAQSVSSNEKVAPRKCEGRIEGVHYVIEQRCSHDAWILSTEIDEQSHFDDALRNSALTPRICFLPSLEKKTGGPVCRGHITP